MLSAEQLAEVAIDRSTQASCLRHLDPRRFAVMCNDRISSVDFPHTKALAHGNRLITITQECGSVHYVNPMGGSELYDKAHFEDRGVTLTFLDPVIK